jgi:hypothetical protein
MKDHNKPSRIFYSHNTNREFCDVGVSVARASDSKLGGGPTAVVRHSKVVNACNSRILGSWLEHGRVVEREQTTDTEKYERKIINDRDILYKRRKL